MRRLGLVLAMCSLFVVFSPAPARAMSWWALEKLSGPAFRSKYWPPSIEVRIYCFKRRAITEGRDTTLMNTQGIGFVLPMCKGDEGEKDGNRVLTDEQRKSWRRYGSVDMSANFARSDSDPLFAAGEQIDLFVFSTSFSFHIAGPLEVGSAVNVNRFSSKGFREPFWNVAFEPVRIDLRPFHINDVDWLTHPDSKLYWLREALVLRAGWIMFPGFSAEQLNSPISLGRESAMYTGVFFDLDTVIRHLTKTW